MVAAAALIVRLAIEAWIISTAGLGIEPDSEEIATFLEENRPRLIIVFLLTLIAVLFFLVLLRGLYSWLGRSRLSAIAVAAGVAGAGSMTVFGAGPALGSMAMPDWLVSNAGDVSLGLAFLVFGIVMLQHRHRYGWVSAAMGVLLAIAGASPAADPHLALLFVIAWSSVIGLRLVRLARQATEPTPT